MQKILAKMRNDFECPGRIFFPDECIFDTNGVFNKHDARFWGLEIFHAVEEVHLMSEKVMVWCRMHKKKINGPCLFSENTVRGINYKKRLNYYAMSKTLLLTKNPTLQPDGASSNSLKDERRYIDNKVSKR